MNGRIQRLRDALPVCSRPIRRLKRCQQRLDGFSAYIGIQKKETARAFDGGGGPSGCLVAFRGNLRQIIVIHQPGACVLPARYSSWPLFLSSMARQPNRPAMTRTQAPEASSRAFLRSLRPSCACNSHTAKSATARNASTGHSAPCAGHRQMPWAARTHHPQRRLAETALFGSRKAPGPPQRRQQTCQ